MVSNFQSMKISNNKIVIEKNLNFLLQIIKLNALVNLCNKP